LTQDSIKIAGIADLHWRNPRETGEDAVTYLRRIMKTTLCTTCLIGFGSIGLGFPYVPIDTLARADGLQDDTKAPLALTAIEMDRIAAGAIPVPYPAFGVASAEQVTKVRSRIIFGDKITGRRPAPGVKRSLPIPPLVLAGIRPEFVEYPPAPRNLITHEITHTLQQRIGRD
jgi:hypothetical protein